MRESKTGAAVMDMRESWRSYYVMFLSAIFSLAIPLAIFALSYLFRLRTSGRKKDQKRLAIYQNRMDFAYNRLNQTILGQRMNVRFFLSANAALVLVNLVLTLIPCVMVLQVSDRQGSIAGVIAVTSITAFALLGLLYAIRKNDVGWRCEGIDLESMEDFEQTK